MKYNPDIFEVIGKFPGPQYHIHLDPGVPSKQTPCHPIPVQLKEVFQQEVNKMLQMGVFQPVQEATPWINSYVLVEGKDKPGNPKLKICLDPTNLKQSYHEGTLPFQNPRGHCPFDCRCLHYDCL